MYTTLAAKSVATAAIVALHGLTGIAFGVATDTMPAGVEVVQLERVVVTGHRTEVVQLPRVLVEGHRGVDGTMVASAGN